MRNFFLLVLLVAFFTSCREEIKVVFPYAIQSEIEQYIQQQDYVIVVYIDSAACTPCSLDHLTLWKTHREELSRSNTGILLVIHNSDEQAIINTLKSIKVTFPFIIDRGRKFKAKNIGIFGMAHDNTFVMDKDRKMVFPGSPIASEEKWKSFVKFVKH
jgi:peroxiredoxin